jgi:anti-sigma-K factor RskA
MSAPLPASPDGHAELAVAWVLHALEPDEDAVFAAHLGDCPGCLRIVAETEDVTTLLGAAAPVVDPPATLREKILSAAAAEPAPDASEASSLALSDRKATPSTDHGATVVPLGRHRRDDGRRSRRITAGLAVAAALALVVAIGGLVAANRSLAGQRDAAAADAARSQEVVQLLDAAAQPGTPHTVLATPAGGFMGLVVDRGRGPEVLASGLAPVDPDHTYVLWGLADGKPVGLTTFEMSGSGPVVQSVPSVAAAGRFTGFAVSLEPGHTVPATPTQVVASGQTAS